MLEVNKIHLGDCMELMKDIDDKSIDMILCDLPYQITNAKWDIIIPFKLLWEQYERIIKDNGVIALFASQPFTSALVMSNPRMFKYEWIWHKNKGGNPLNAKSIPMKQHESILIFYKKKPIYNPQMEERYGQGKDRVKYKVQGGRFNDDRVYGEVDHVVRNTQYSELRYPQSVQFCEVERGLHPTQKPVKIMEYFLKTYTNEGDLILDNCIGSGTTAMASKNTGRNFIGIEKDKKYYDIAVNRINNMCTLMNN